MRKLKEFPCTQCGACCRRVKGLMPVKEDGSCIYLEDNKCSIYEDRPLLCNIYKGYELFRDKMTRGEFYKMNAEFCTKFIIEDKLDTEYMIDLTQF